MSDEKMEELREVASGFRGKPDKRTLKRIAELLRPDERPVAVMNGQIEKGSRGNKHTMIGALVLTTQRVLFCGMTGLRAEHVSYEIADVNSAASSKGIMTGGIEVTVAGDRLDVIRTIKDDVPKFLAALQEALADHRTAVPAPAATPANLSLADELAKLARLRDDGILSDDEFAAQKARLLGSA